MQRKVRGLSVDFFSFLDKINDFDTNSYTLMSVDPFLFCLLSCYNFIILWGFYFFTGKLIILYYYIGIPINVRNIRGCGRSKSETWGQEGIGAALSCWVLNICTFGMNGKRIYLSIAPTANSSYIGFCKGKGFP